MTRPSRRRGALLAGVAALSLTVVAGCSGGEDPQPPAPADPPASSAPAPSTPASSSPQAGPSSGASPSAAPSPSGSAGGGGAGEAEGSDALLAAGETAAGAVADGVVVSIDPERRGTVWEVDVVTSDGTLQEVVTSADGSEVTSGPTEDRSDAEDRAENQELTGAALDFGAAVAAAEDEVGGTVTQLALDSDDGRLTWEVDVDGPDGPRDLVLDADDGTVLQDEADD